jgi:ubiquitin carboxyl-terminal hydrolase 4/11
MSEVDSALNAAEKEIQVGGVQKPLQILSSIEEQRLTINSYIKRAELYEVLNSPVKAEQDLTQAINLVLKEAPSKRAHLQSILSKRVKIREDLAKFSDAVDDYQQLYELTQDASLLEAQKRLLKSEKEAKIKLEAGELLMIFKSNLETKPGSEWHVVSMKWFELWQNYVQLSTFYMEEEIPFKVFSKTLIQAEHPGPIDNSDIIDEAQTNVILEDPANPHAKVCLKKGMSENFNYVLLPAPAFEYLYRIYGCEKDLKRFAIEINDTMYQVEVVLRTVSIAITKRDSLDTDQMNVSSKDTIDSLKKSYLAIKKLNSSTKVWKINLLLVSMDKLQTLIKTNDTVYIEGAKVLNESLLIDDAELSEQDLVFIETPRNNRFLFTDDKRKVADRCGFCQSSASLPVSCSRCKLVKYCSTVCAQKHQADHTASCRPPRRSLLRCFCRTSLAEHDEDDAQVVPAESIIRYKSGLTGLQNLGNTCFMNSAIQCLSHTNELTDVFLSGKYLDMINKTNPLGTNGKLTMAYAEALHNLWKGNSSSFAPWKLKRTISAFAPQFVGYQQHDSQELLGLMLDRLHEDLNQVKRKPYFEDNDAVGRSHEEMARESWRRHTLRNKSVIVDLMHGQYKSSVLCPTCKKHSYTFDPFNSITLPLPQSQEKNFSFYFIFYDSAKPPYSMSCEYAQGTTIEQFNSEVARLLDVASGSFFFASILNDVIKEMLDFKRPIDQLRSFTLFAYQKKSDADLENIELQVGIEKGKTRTSSYSRIVCISQNATFKELHYEIFSKFRHNFPRMSNRARVQDLYEDLMTSPAYMVYFVVQKEIPCQFCGEKSCKGCPIPYSSERIRRLFRGSRIIVEIVWKQNHQTMGANLQDLNRCTEHASVADVLQKSKKNAVRLEECFELFKVPEQLEKENAWYCPNCKAHVQATKKLEIYRAPDVLIIHIKRFKVSGHSREKLYNPVIFPEEGLDIRNWVISNENLKPYDLYAVCNHFGNLSGGHYTATCYSSLNKQWFDFKDSQVSLSGPNRDNAASAYVLFYRARK